MKHLSTLARSLLATLLVAAPLLVATPAYAISTYTVTHLGGTLASRVNEQGDVAGWGVVNGFTKAFVYTAEDGFVYLTLPPGQTYSLAEDVSDRDVNGRIHIVGSAYPGIMDEPGTAYRWTYQPGVGLVEITSLGTVGTDPYSVGRGINGLGEVVGESDPRSLFSGGANAFIYDDVNGMQSLGFKGKPQEINDSSQIVGYGSTVANAWRYTNGVFEDLGKPAGTNIAWAYAINDSGSVAGAAILPTNLEERVARYTDAGGWQLLGGIGQTNIGWGINNSGAVVGEGVADFTGRGLRGVIYTDDINRLAYIEDFVEAGDAAWNITAAYDINNNGLIAAAGENAVTGAGGGLLLVPTAGPPLTVPDAPTNLAGTTTQTGIQLTWTDNSDNELVFSIERRNLGDTDFAPLTTASFPSYHDAAVANCASYEYRVSAYNDAGFSAFSNIAQADAPCIVPPAAPSNLTAQNSLGDVVLNWSDNSDNETHFEVQRDAGQGFATIDTATGSSYIDGNVQLCTLYRYQVRAVNVAGASAYSNVAEVTSACPPTGDVEPPVVTILEPTDGAVFSFSDVPVRASVTDNAGIARVSVYVNDKRICSSRVRSKTAVLSTEISCEWRTRKYTAGDYTIRVLAIDSEGYEGASSVTVTLQNTLGGGGKGGKRNQTQDTADSAILTFTDQASSGGSTGSLGWLSLLLAAWLPLRRRLRG